MMKYIILIYLFLVCILSFSQTGSLSGKAIFTDEDYFAECPFSKISIGNYQALSDFDGNYFIDSIPIGIHEITAVYLDRGPIQKVIEIIEDSVITVNFNFICKYNNSIDNKKCPICHLTDSVIPTSYGSRIKPFKGASKTKPKTSYYIGDQVRPCHPHWFCLRDKVAY